MSGMVGLSGQQNAVLPYSALAQPEFPLDERLGRVNLGRIEIKAWPDGDSQTVGTLYEDAVVSWLQYKIENGISPRLYYRQVTWVDQLKTGQDGQV